jgi:hypothetical protein
MDWKRLEFVRFADSDHSNSCAELRLAENCIRRSKIQFACALIWETIRELSEHT